MRKKTICLLIITLIALSIYPLVPNTKAQTGPTVALAPATYQVSQLQQTFTLSVTISNVQSLWSWTVEIAWDPTVLSLVGTPQTGGFLEQAGTAQFLATPAYKGATGAETINDVSYSTIGVSGSGVLATIEFQVNAETSTSVQLGNITLEGPNPGDPSYGTPITLAPPTSSTTTISFVSGAPVANPGSDQTITEGATVTFDGSKSLPSGSITAYSWSFMYDGAKQTLTGENPTFTFNILGIYVVTLIVTDSNGASTPATVTITVNNKSQPVAVINVEGASNGQVPAGLPITFNGTGSYEANNGTITRYLWTAIEISQTDTSGKTTSAKYGSATIGTNATVKYTFTLGSDLKSEIYNVTLTVFDLTNQNGTASIQITVGPGSNPTSTPTATTTPTSTPSSTSSATANPTSTPTPNNTAQSGLPPDVVAITIIVTIMAIGGSTIWLRKRT
jgi:PKD repeat protein